MTFPFPFFPVSSVVPIDISYVDTATSTADLTTYTFSARSFGDAAADRVIAVGIVSRATAIRSITGVTIGGVTATEISNGTGPNSGGATNTALFAALVPTGTTGDVVVTHSAGQARCAIAIHRLIGADLGSATGAFNSDNNPSASINVVRGGAAIAISYSAANTSATWTGIDEDVDATVESQSYSAAHRAFANAASSHAIQCNWASNSTPGFAYAVFAPA
jgi:hypothetical protein